MADASGKEQGECGTTMANAEAEQEPCHFLNLPPELREEIYKLCLEGLEYDIGVDKDDQPIFFTGVVINELADNPPPLPALLHTCRLVRAEAVPLWLKLNSFCFCVNDLNAQLLYQWMEFCHGLLPPPDKPEYGSAYRPMIQIFSTNGTYIWENVSQWCKWVHEGKLEPPSEPPYYQGQHLIAGALKIAFVHRGRPWEDCEGSLDGLRLALEGAWRKMTIL
ncbi:hypothetical protein PRZ48_005054 [Zasmidium cellare]|uniref:2EXR domain-containing protein n=1 Tax=Zasmidium cellare TaxID=395010 RepID=A0ABR0ESG0_ZASCE|nr:hypothetical protein PRZ48_005054 [Zasmidium cellare]